eukprot:scaffold401_cov399-Prasinococcus_capsulatus_cf.AAC.16
MAGTEEPVLFDIGALHIAENAEGWGPTAQATKYDNLPYAPFSRSERVGKASDFTSQGFKYDRRYGDRAPTTSVFNFHADQEEDSFHLVDSRPVRGSGGFRGRRPWQNRAHQRRDTGTADVGRDQGAGAERERQRRQRTQQKRQSQWSNNMWHDRRNQQSHSASVEIRPEWTVLEQIDLPALTKLNFTLKEEPENLYECGALCQYDKTLDRATPRIEKPLRRFASRSFFKVTTSEDPIIQKLAEEDKAQVFATDSILSTLMCVTRSAYPWDIVIQRVGNKLYFDKRNDEFDLLTVSETAQESLVDDKESNSPNTVQALGQEATVINQNFSQQALLEKAPKHEFKERDPFVTQGVDAAPVAYRYRRWVLDEDTSLVVRCQLDAVGQNRGQEALMTVKALNEYDSKMTGVDWRQKIENQRGAVMATELKNNAMKLAKWTAEANMAGADLMKIGFISRVHTKDNYNHVILATQGYKPKDFAAQINLAMNNSWGIVKALVDMCMKLDEGKYLLVKDPNKPLMRLYEVPADAFDNDDYAEEPLAEEEPLPEAPEA